MEYVPHCLKNVLASPSTDAFKLITRTDISVESVARQLLSALDYLHSNKIVHRDVKPGNILVTDEGIVKLCDFEQAIRLDSEEGTAREVLDELGTYGYRAPELILRDPKCDWHVDIWAVGCVIYEVSTRHPAFPGNLQPWWEELATQVRNLDYFAPDLLVLLRNLLIFYLREVFKEELDDDLISISAMLSTSSKIIDSLGTDSLGGYHNLAELALQDSLRLKDDSMYKQLYSSTDCIFIKKKLVERCLQMSPKDRPSCSQLMQEVFPEHVEGPGSVQSPQRMAPETHLSKRRRT
jgi:serine/threonine protein kinase